MISTLTPHFMHNFLKYSLFQRKRKCVLSNTIICYVVQNHHFMMLSDAPFTSPWSSEVFITGAYKLPLDTDTEDDDNVLDLYKSSYNNNEQLAGTSESSCKTTGSDCSIDDLYLDGDDDAFMLDIDADPCIQALDADLNDLIDSATFGGAVWSDDDEDISSNCSFGSPTIQQSTDWEPDSIPVASQAFTCSTIKPSSKLQSCRLKNSPCKKWSHMTKSQKTKTVDELSLAISNELSLREQMDIIKIIDPSATFTKQNSEFVIDLNAIDDVKLEKIQDIVNFHCIQSSDVTRDHHSHNANRKFSKKNKSQDRKPKIEKQRVQKEYRQKLKEKRSGLFVKEERLAVSETIMEEDIDILG